MTGDTVQSNFKGLRSTRWRRIFSERKQDGGKGGEREGQLEKARDIYTTNRNLPEVPLYSLPLSFSLSRLPYPSKRCVSARVNSFSATVGKKRKKSLSAGDLNLRVPS